MDVSNALRQVQELENIFDIKYGIYKDAIKITTPTLLSRLQRIKPSTTVTKKQLEVKKCISFHLNCATLYPDELDNLILQFEFPLNYPSNSTCFVRAVQLNNDDSGDNDSYSEHKSCTDAINKYLEPFVGFECVELVLEWLTDNKEICLKNLEEDDKTNDCKDGEITCYVLRYNHLLSGPEHKKEKSMLDCAKKSKLQGGLLWGTPGVVIIVPPSTEDDAKEYASDCRSIGKRPDGVESVWLPQSGIEQSGLGGLAQMKRGGKLQELDTAKMRELCGGNEDLLRFVLKVH